MPPTWTCAVKMHASCKICIRKWLYMAVRWIRVSLAPRIIITKEGHGNDPVQCTCYAILTHVEEMFPYYEEKKITFFFICLSHRTWTCRFTCFSIITLVCSTFSSFHLSLLLPLFLDINWYSTYVLIFSTDFRQCMILIVKIDLKRV